MFAPGVTLAATVKDVGGKGLFAKSGPAVASMSGTLNSSDEQLALELRYTHRLVWPQARDVSANSFMNLNAPAGTRRIDAAAIVVAEQATIDVPAGTAVGDDASLAKRLSGKGIELGKVLTKPTVTPRAGGGFDITFRILRNVALQQFGAAPA